MVEEPTGHVWVLAAMLEYALAVEGPWHRVRLEPEPKRWAVSYSAPLEIACSSRQGLLSLPMASESRRVSLKHVSDGCAPRLQPISISMVGF